MATFADLRQQASFVNAAAAVRNYEVDPRMEYRTIAGASPITKLYFDVALHPSSHLSLPKAYKDRS